MGQRYMVLRHWTEADIPGPVAINLIHHVEVEDAETRATAEGSAWSEGEAQEEAIRQLGGAG